MHFVLFIYITDIDECLSNPCFNEATCNDFVAFYNCTCAEGFEDKHCSTGMKISSNLNLKNCISAFCHKNEGDGFEDIKGF